MIMKTDLVADRGYSGKPNGLIKPEDLRQPDISDFMIWDKQEAKYGKSLSNGSVLRQLGAIKSAHNQEVLMTYLSEFNGEHFDRLIPMYNQCNFAKGVVKRSHHGYVLNVNGEEIVKVPLSTLVHIFPVKSLEKFDDLPLLQFTFNSGLTSDKNSFYLRDVVDTNLFTAANNLIDILSAESNLHIPVRLKNIQMPEQGYAKQLEGSYAKKGILLFEKDKMPKYDNM